jgi:hypothetical protein
LAWAIHPDERSVGVSVRSSGNMDLVGLAQIEVMI